MFVTFILLAFRNFVVFVVCNLLYLLLILFIIYLFYYENHTRAHKWTIKNNSPLHKNSMSTVLKLQIQRDKS